MGLEIKQPRALHKNVTMDMVPQTSTQERSICEEIMSNRAAISSGTAEREIPAFRELAMAVDPIRSGLMAIEAREMEIPFGEMKPELSGLRT